MKVLVISANFLPASPSGPAYIAGAALAETLRVQVMLATFEGDPAHYDQIAPWLEANQPEIQENAEAPGITPWAETQHLAHLIWIQAQMAISSQGADSTKTTILNQCLDYLDQRLKVAHQRKLSFRIIECSLIMAMVLNELEHTNRAVKMLEQTLALAEPEEYYRVFLDLGQPLSLLLQKVDTNHTDANFAQRLIAKIAVLTRGKPASQNLLDSLSVRELEVLGLISRGLSNREIGEQLHLALDTIKGHNRRIFEKLGVRKRIEAVEKARQLGLL